MRRIANSKSKKLEIINGPKMNCQKNIKRFLCILLGEDRVDDFVEERDEEQDQHGVQHLKSDYR